MQQISNALLIFLKRSDFYKNVQYNKTKRANIKKKRGKHHIAEYSCTYGGIDVVPSIATSFAMSLTAMMEGVDIDF